MVKGRVRWEKYKEKILELEKQPFIEYSLNWIKKINTYEKIVLFGAGEHGKNWINMLNSYNVKVDYICDNNKELWGEKIEGIVCISPNNIARYGDGMVVILAVRSYLSIYEQLIQIGIKADNIMIATTDVIGFKTNYLLSKNKELREGLCQKIWYVADACEDELSTKICYQTLKKWLVNQKEVVDYTGESYFIPEIRRYEEEVFVDAGAYNGDTLDKFLKEYKNSFCKYYAFEIDKRNYEKLNNKVTELPQEIKRKIYTYNLGLWNEKRDISYNSNFQTTKIALEGVCQGKVDCLDSILNKKKVTFIKMDIEGAELEALDGCREHIRKYEPVLAISMYHSMNDFIKIPFILKDFGYKIIIRHHAIDDSDVVCYAYK